ncbi:MAG: putative ATP-dependent endonuclease of the family [Solirubrobacterales bacterium]|jgi:putative ATP-dependent endonuclease of OLD family|nr:putative ATP-dependent endonuclease of the family [Solirubrobacterales bacterium]
MRITSLFAKGYRNLDGSYGLPAPLAVVVGENNAGKSNLIDALRTVLEPDNPARGRSWLGPDDFAHDGTGTPITDELELGVRLEQLDGQEQSRMLTCLAPEEGAGVAKLRMKARLGVDGRVRVEWFGGNSEHPDVERHAREAIRFVYLHPLRDAAADLRPGRDNKLVPLLAALTPNDHEDREKVVKLVEESNQRLDQVGKIVEARGQVDQRLQGMTGGKRFAQKSTLAFGDPVFLRIVGTLRAKIGELVALEMDQNGLGFNNLLYMAVLLAAIADGDTEEDPHLRVMLIEEPEAHLHPQLQDLLMRFIEKEAGKRTQVIVTSHSPNFASSAKVDRLTVMSRPVGGGAPVARLPARFGLESKQLAFLHRFLDVTKASLFFARGVILVEGIAEQLLLPQLAHRLGKDLPPAGVSVINIGGVAFPPFSDLFGPGRLPYRLAVVSDSDPEAEAEEDVADALSPRAAKLKARVADNNNVEVFLSEQTFEWDLAKIPGNRALMIKALSPFKPQVAKKLPDELADLEDDAAATLLYQKIGRLKGPFAQSLAELLADFQHEFEPPAYLSEGIDWALGDPIFAEPSENGEGGESGASSPAGDNTPINVKE